MLLYLGKMDSNRIYLIELYIPKKSDVLAYLDRGGKKPTRQARVIVANGAKNPPDVEEYLVEPLPNPSRHSILKMAGYSYPIHFASRPYSSLEDVVIDKMLTNATRDCYTVLKESFGFWYHNCTSTCLTFVVDGVAVADQVGQRQSWVMFFRNRRGLDLLPVPFEVLVDHADTDTNKWKILKVCTFTFKVCTSVFTNCRGTYHAVHFTRNTVLGKTEKQTLHLQIASEYVCAKFVFRFFRFIERAVP